MNKKIKKSLERDTFRLGDSFVFPPHVIDDIHVKSELGRYRMRGFSLFKKIPHWDELTFLPGTLTRFVIEGYREKCETKTLIGPRAKRPIELEIPIYVTGMSFGALSYEAKTALARGATMAGTATCSGEGGMIPDERRYSTKWLYQCIQSRYGFNPNHLILADGCEFFIGQGCKVGLGGHLMGQKVTDQVAEMRSLPAGIDQRSPARHPDWLGPDDLALKIQEIREVTDWQIPIQLKLGAARGCRSAAYVTVGTGIGAAIWANGGLTGAQRRAVEDTVETSLAERITVRNLAEVSGLSPRQFSRAFTVSYGVPPYEWVLRQRVERVRDLLAEGQKASDVAVLCGFSSQAHMIRRFRAVFGYTPTAVR